VLPGGALGIGIARGTFGLFLFLTGRSGRRFTGAEDEDPTAAGAVLFLLPRGRPRPHGAVGKPRFRWVSSASAMETSLQKRNPR
jgi:hypothetical protein